MNSPANPSRPQSSSWPAFMWGSLLGLLGGLSFVLWYLPQLLLGPRPSHLRPSPPPSLDQALAEGQALAQRYHSSGQP
jgi:hypothetical protein